MCSRSLSSVAAKKWTVGVTALTPNDPSAILRSKAVCSGQAPNGGDRYLHKPQSLAANVVYTHPAVICVLPYTSNQTFKPTSLTVVPIGLNAGITIRKKPRILTSLREELDEYLFEGLLVHHSTGAFLKVNKEIHKSDYNNNTWLLFFSF